MQVTADCQQGSSGLKIQTFVSANMWMAPYIFFYMESLTVLWCEMTTAKTKISENKEMIHTFE